MKRKRRSDRAAKPPCPSKRKRRSDRAYLIYKITCTVNGETYVGLVVRIDQAVKRTLARRLSQHTSRALGTAKGWEEPRPWNLHVAIRKHGAGAFWIELLETVRGKAQAHVRECELMVLHNCTLNTSMRKQ